MTTATPAPMTTITFSGESYFAPGHAFTEPGDYPVTEEKAEQLLTDFPQLFTKAPEPQMQPKEAAKVPTREQEKKGT